MVVDVIIIEDLAGLFYVGVPEEERSKPQRLLVSLKIFADFTSAAANDDLTNTVDYFAVSRAVLALSQGRSWRLIEKLAIDIAGLVLADTNALEVTVEVKKFIIPEARYVAVRAHRSRNSAPSGTIEV